MAFKKGDKFLIHPAQKSAFAGAVSLDKVYTVVDLGASSDDLAWFRDDKGNRDLALFSEVTIMDESTSFEGMKVTVGTQERDPSLTPQQQQKVTMEALREFYDHPKLKKLHGRLPKKPTVVGGAARDWDFNIPAQDIDIWCEFIVRGEDHLKLLKEIFEPLGGEVNQVTNNTYARDGEYIHYIFNVMWKGVDLQFIFVTDPSAKAVIDHVCCNFSEIAWDWMFNVLEPTYKYKAGRMSKVLIFSDDKGRSPRDCYIAKMAARYPDHKVVLPKSCKHLQGTYSDRVCTPEVDMKEPDGTWGDPRQALMNDMGRALVEGPKLPEVGDWVMSIKTHRFQHLRGSDITYGNLYEVLEVLERSEGDFSYKVKADGGVTGHYASTDFRPVETKIIKANDEIPKGYSKCVVRINRGTDKGNYWKELGKGNSPHLHDAHVYDCTNGLKPSTTCENLLIFIE